MSRIRGKDTKPEMLIRRGLHGRGLRYRLHGTGIPGKPDMVFPKYRTVVFVHGCFWHGHGCSLFKWPKTRAAFWQTKINRNMERDQEALAALRADGWRALVVWECALKGKYRRAQPDVLSDADAFIRQGRKSFAECQWRSKKGPPRRCKKGPLGGCGLVPVVHGRAPRATRRALNRLTRRRAREGPVGPRGQAWAGWSVQFAVGV